MFSVDRNGVATNVADVPVPAEGPVRKRRTWKATASAFVALLVSVAVLQFANTAAVNNANDVERAAEAAAKSWHWDPFFDGNGADGGVCRFEDASTYVCLIDGGRAIVDMLFRSPDDVPAWSERRSPYAK